MQTAAQNTILTNKGFDEFDLRRSYSSNIVLHELENRVSVLLVTEQSVVEGSSFIVRSHLPSQGQLQVSKQKSSKKSLFYKES